MVSATITAYPTPYSEHAHALWSTEGAAGVACAGAVSLADFLVTRSGLLAFISEHVTEHRPRRIEARFGKPRFCNGLGVHVTDDNIFKLFDQVSGHHVQVVLSAVSNLRMDGPCSLSVSGSLRNGQCIFMLREPAVIFNRAPVAARGQVFTPKVERDGSASASRRFCDFALERNIPSSARVLHETASLDRAAELSRLPEAIDTAHVRNGIIFDLDGAFDKRHPSQGLSTPALRVLFVRIARLNKGGGDSGDGIGMQFARLGMSSEVLDQIVMRRPPEIRSGRIVMDEDHSLFVSAAAPCGIDAHCQCPQVLCRGGVLDTVTVAQYHVAQYNHLWSMFQHEETNCFTHEN